jgi:tRNA threonylcarbamoyladenosine biosynthesis protein TsaB
VGAVLAIETSQRRGAVALRTAAGAVDEEPLRALRRHDDDLLPAIDRICRRHGVAPSDLGAVGVSVGPGGFTGLRIAVSTAKMIGEATGAALVAVESALVAAESLPSPHPAQRVIVGLAAKGETFWCTRLRRTPQGWSIDGDAGIVGSTDQLHLEHGLDAIIADEHLPGWAAQACAAAGVERLEPVLDPRALLQLTDRGLREGSTTDPLALLPLYPRPPEAVTLWESGKGMQD